MNEQWEKLDWMRQDPSPLSTVYSIRTCFAHTQKIYIRGHVREIAIPATIRRDALIRPRHPTDLQTLHYGLLIAVFLF